jgi:predicted RNA binding protein YcfA (HicA-like mRNA interferase family)
MGCIEMLITSRQYVGSDQASFVIDVNAGSILSHEATPTLLAHPISRANVSFADFERLVFAFGFMKDRQNGSHRIYKHSIHLDARLNFQPIDGQVKPYQIKQFLKLVEEYNLQLDEHEDPEI